MVLLPGLWMPYMQKPISRINIATDRPKYNCFNYKNNKISSRSNRSSKTAVVNYIDNVNIKRCCSCLKIVSEYGIVHRLVSTLHDIKKKTLLFLSQRTVYLCQNWNSQNPLTTWSYANCTHTFSSENRTAMWCDWLLGTKQQHKTIHR